VGGFGAGITNLKKDSANTNKTIKKEE